MKHVFIAATAFCLLCPMAPSQAENWVKMGEWPGTSCIRYFDSDSVQRIGSNDVRYRIKRQCTTPRFMNDIEYSALVIHAYMRCKDKTVAVSGYTFFNTSGQQVKQVDIEQAWGLEGLEFLPVREGEHVAEEYEQVCHPLQ